MTTENKKCTSGFCSRCEMTTDEVTKYINIAYESPIDNYLFDSVENSFEKEGEETKEEVNDGEFY